MRTIPAVARAVARGVATLFIVPVADCYSHHVSHGKTVVRRPFRPAVGTQQPLHGGQARRQNGRLVWVTDVGLYVDIVHIELTEQGRPPILGHLTAEQALAAGLPSPREFEIAWVRHHDRSWIERQVGPLREIGENEDDIAAAIRFLAPTRYADFWAVQPAWWLTVRPADKPVILPGLPLEPEAVDAASQERITMKAGMATEQWLAIDHAQRDAELARLSLGQQLDAILEEARKGGHSVTSEIRLIEKRLLAVQAKIRRMVA